MLYKRVANVAGCYCGYATFCTTFSHHRISFPQNIDIPRAIYQHSIYIFSIELCGLMLPGTLWSMSRIPWKPAPGDTYMPYSAMQLAGHVAKAVFQEQCDHFLVKDFFMPPSLLNRAMEKCDTKREERASPILEFIVSILFFFQLYGSSFFLMQRKIPSFFFFFELLFGTLLAIKGDADSAHWLLSLTFAALRWPLRAIATLPHRPLSNISDLLMLLLCVCPCRRILVYVLL